ncbi:MAG: hypothetical protein ACXWEX_04125, partial [Thermoanaerobaculia bacterium]
RPFVPRLADEELDLLLSRSLDGDLSPEEEHGLETILAHDPAAARRKEELQRLVAEARALPAPAPPFALATRVNSNVSEKAGRGGSVFHRFGFYPPPGMVVGAMALLGIVVAAITVLKPAPLRVAERVEGPVDVFLTEGENAAKRPRPETPKVASKEATRNQVAAAPAAPAPAEPAPAVVASALEEKFKEKQVDAGKDAGKVDSWKKLDVQAPASVVAVNEPASPASEEKQDRQRQKLSKTEGDVATAPARRQAAPAPALDAAAGRAVGGIGATAAKASGALANAEPARTWSVAVRGEGARRWMLRRAPEGRPSVASTQASAFRITLDAEGRVTSVRALDVRPVQPALLEFVRGLVFAPVVTVTDGILRDEKANDERADAIADRPAEHPSEIEVEISTR